MVEQKEEQAEKEYEVEVERVVRETITVKANNWEDILKGDSPDHVLRIVDVEQNVLHVDESPLPQFAIETSAGVIVISPRSDRRVIVKAACPDKGIRLSSPDRKDLIEAILPVVVYTHMRNAKEWRSTLASAVKIAGKSGKSGIMYNQEINGQRWRKKILRFTDGFFFNWIKENKDVFNRKVFDREKAAAKRRSYNAAEQF